MGRAARRRAEPGRSSRLPASDVCWPSSWLQPGENVIDVPATLATRVRLLGSTKAAKNDPNDALATAVAGLRHCGLRAVATDRHSAVVRMLVDRHQALTSSRTQAVCRLPQAAPRDGARWGACAAQR